MWSFPIFPRLMFIRHIQNPKLQAPNNKQIPMTEIQNPKKFWSFGNCNLEFIWDLDIGIWSFKGQEDPEINSG